MYDTYKRRSTLQKQKQEKNEFTSQLYRSKSENIIKRNLDNPADGKDRSSIESILEKTIQNANNKCQEKGESGYTEDKNTSSVAHSSGVWSLTQISDKRTIKGSKAIVRWSDENTGIHIELRVVISENYSSMVSDDIFVELNSANIKFTTQELKAMQQEIDKMLEHEKKQQRYDFLVALNTLEFCWLKTILFNLHKRFRQSNLQSKQKLKDSREFVRREINRNYMPFPATVCLSWSPHHELCLIEERLNYYPRPIIGAMKCLRTLMQKTNKYQSFQRKAEEEEEIVSYKQKQEELEADALNLYDWDMNEEVNFAIFKSENHDQRQIERKDTLEISLPSLQRNRSKVEIQVNKHETLVCENVSKVPPKILPIYKRFLSVSKGLEIPRLVKIKIYTSENMVEKLESNIIYLVNRIRNLPRQHDSLVGVLLKNEMKGYPELLRFRSSQHAHRNFRALEYKWISHIIREHSAQYPHSHQLLYLKAIILENEYLHCALETHFRNHFKRIRAKPKHDLRCALGSYLHFDDERAESILFELLANCLRGTDSNEDQCFQSEKYQRSQALKTKQDYLLETRKLQELTQGSLHQSRRAKERRKTMYLNDRTEGMQIPAIRLHSQNLSMQEIKEHKQPALKATDSLTANVNRNGIQCLVIPKLQLLPFKLELILPERERTSLLNVLVRALSMNTHKKQSMQQIIYKKVLVTNAKLINFAKSLNNLVNKFNNREFAELAALIHMYSRVTNDSKRAESGTEPRRQFIAYCAGCVSSMRVSNLAEFLQPDSAGGAIFQESAQDFNCIHLSNEYHMQNGDCGDNGSASIRPRKYCSECRAFND